jgi:hypothetical protein
MYPYGFIKRTGLRLFDRLTDRAGRRIMDNVITPRTPLIGRPFGDSFNMIDVAFFEAAKASAAFWREHMIAAKAIKSPSDLLIHALGLVQRQGLFLEFGVATGHTISQIARHNQATQIFGFDSFEGLPDSWRTGFPAGAFSGPVPPVPPNVSLIKGWFCETLPRFVIEHSEPVAFLHVDCDLYSSTKCIFDTLKSQIGPGCVIVFDEYFNYPGWEDHEHKAFRELIDQCGLEFRYDAFVPDHQQACVVIK